MLQHASCPSFSRLIWEVVECRSSTGGIFAMHLGSTLDSIVCKSRLVGIDLLDLRAASESHAVHIDAACARPMAQALCGWLCKRLQM